MRSRDPPPGEKPGNWQEKSVSVSVSGRIKGGDEIGSIELVNDGESAKA